MFVIYKYMESLNGKKIAVLGFAFNEQIILACTYVHSLDNKWLVKMAKIQFQHTLQF